MKIRHEDLIGSFEQQKNLVMQFTLFQDIFFSAVMKNKDAAEYVLRLCTGIPDLTIVSSDIQKSLRNLIGKSAVLDFVAQDSTGKVYNIEVQNTDDEEYFGPMRARYYQSLLDASLAPKGLSYDKLPEMYIIFITPFNPLKANGHHKVMYEKKSLLEDVPWDNKVHEIYLNAEETDESQLSEMLQYFRTADPADTRFGALSETVREQKGVKEEIADMCKAVEDYAKSYAKEREAIKAAKFVNNLLAEGFALEKALQLAGIDEETYRQYAEKADAVSE